MRRFSRNISASIRGRVYNANECTQALLPYISKAASLVAQSSTYAFYIFKSLPLPDLASQLAQWTIKHPCKTALMLVSGTTFIAPGLITWLFLGMLGFSAEGVVSGKFFLLSNFRTR
jgi:hypothetical protein